jgi:hypothetical protein
VYSQFNQRQKQRNLSLGGRVDADADDETITNDEQDYDEISASNFEEVFRDTSTNAELMALYKSAAGLCFPRTKTRY